MHILDFLNVLQFSLYIDQLQGSLSICKLHIFYIFKRKPRSDGVIFRLYSFICGNILIRIHMLFTFKVQTSKKQRTFSTVEVARFYVNHMTTFAENVPIESRLLRHRFDGLTYLKCRKNIKIFFFSFIRFYIFFIKV